MSCYDSNSQWTPTIFINETKEVKHIASANDGQQDSETTYDSDRQYSSYATDVIHKVRKVPQLLLSRNYMIARVHKANSNI